MTDTTAGHDQKSTVWTIKSLLQVSADYLKEKGIETGRLDAEILMCQIFDCRRIELYTNSDKPVSTQERAQFKELFRRRAMGEPVAYITGQKDFYGRSFHVTKDVLIPRPDTELIMDVVKAENLLGPEKSILDIGTGSGCLAISLALEEPLAKVSAWDVGPEPLAIARQNAEKHGAAIAWGQCDALKADSYPKTPTFDVIVSNPPYISRSELPSMSQHVVGFEPHRALFAADDGLAFYRCFAKFAQASLLAGGRLIMEIGWQQSQAVSELFQEAGWTQIKAYRDLQKIERVIAVSPPE